MDLLKWPYVSFLQKYNTQSVKENDKLILELTYAEFEWASIEEFIVDIQLVRYDGTVNTFVRNALFEKKGQNFARFQLQDAGYDRAVDL